MAISAEHIIKALGEDDFAFEMRVGKAIRDIAGFSVLHGGTYTDSVSNKPRQFDFIAEITKEATRLLIAVECKNISSEAPLVVSSISRPCEEAFHELVRSHNGAWMRSGSPIIGASSTSRRIQGVDSFYAQDKVVGKSSFRLKPKKPNGSPERCSDSEIYEAWSQALSSAVAFAGEACTLAPRHKVPTFLTAILPVVVVPNCSLWQVVYDKNGEIQGDPAKTDACEFFVGRSIELGYSFARHSFTFSHIHFFTISGFTSFLSKMAVNDHAWSNLFGEQPPVA